MGWDIPWLRENCGEGHHARALEERISPPEQELGILLLGRETLDVKQPFGDRVADLGKGVPKPVCVGKRRKLVTEKNP